MVTFWNNWPNETISNGSKEIRFECEHGQQVSEAWNWNVKFTFSSTERMGRVSNGNREHWWYWWRWKVTNMEMMLVEWAIHAVKEYFVVHKYISAINRRQNRICVPSKCVQWQSEHAAHLYVRHNRIHFRWCYGLLGIRLLLACLASKRAKEREREKAIVYICPHFWNEPYNSQLSIFIRYELHRYMMRDALSLLLSLFSSLASFSFWLPLFAVFVALILFLSTFYGDLQRTAKPYCIHKTCRFDDIADSNAAVVVEKRQIKSKSVCTCKYQVTQREENHRTQKTPQQNEKWQKT